MNKKITYNGLTKEQQRDALSILNTTHDLEALEALSCTYKIEISFDESEDAYHVKTDDTDFYIY